VRLIRRLALLLLLALLFGPFLIPVNTSGTLSKEQAAERVWAGHSKFVELASHEVHLVEAGDPNSENLLILMHGFGASSFSYKENLEILGEVAHVIAYDRAAFGFTERPTDWEINPYGTPGQLEVIDDIVTKYGSNKNVFLLGHSAGGSIAASYAVDNQEKLAGVILFAPAIGLGGGGGNPFNWIFDIPQLDHVGPLLVSTIATSGLDLIYASYFDETQVTEEVLAGYTAPLEVAGWERAFWEFNKAPRDPEISERFTEIQIPTLVITGDTDVVVDTERSVEIAGLLPDAELVIIAETGHLPNEEKPEEFANTVSEFIRKTLGS
jgi:pimeloyl-ACP methyl ester carboxylesterase